MRAIHYAKALHDLSFSEKIEGEVLAKQFVSIVLQNGHANLFRKILRSLEKILRHEEKQNTIEISSAKELSQEDVGALLKKDPFKRALLASHKKVVRKVDETLVGGIVVRTGVIKIDASHKRALIDLYQSLTSM